MAFAVRTKDRSVMVNACHLDDVVSTLSRNLGFGDHETADHAAGAPAGLATCGVNASPPN